MAELNGKKIVFSPHVHITYDGTGDIDEPITFEQQNNAVKKFIEEVTYTSDYSTSSIEEYVALVGVGERGDRPNGASITLNSNGMFTVYDADNGGVITAQKSSGATTQYNVTPNVFSHFVNQANGHISQCGQIKSTGNIRMINGDGNTFNIRDLGGWTCDGGVLKYNKIFRGCELNGENGVVLNSAQIAFFRDYLGIRDEIDLRGNAEVDNDEQDPLDDITSSALGDTVDYVRYPILEYASGVDLTKSVQTGYYRDILKRIANDLIKGKPIYLHCAAGADRTGTVCCLIEAICGVTQSDIDKDYELTSFAVSARKRNSTSWTGLINRINSFSGATFRDKVVDYALQAGVSIEEINAIRNGLIDGTPSALTSPYTAATVTRSLTNTTIDNTNNTAVKYQPYEANIKAAEGKVISSLSITMGGVDITSLVFSGTKVNLLRQVTKTLTNCTLNNGKSVVIDGEGYAAVITPDANYTLETVQITMGGVDVTASYYSDGKILIPSVTGNLVITATAESQALINMFDSATAILNARLNSSGGVSADQSGANPTVLVTDYIPVTSLDVVKLITDAAQYSGGTYNYSGMIALYDSSKTWIANYQRSGSSAHNWVWNSANTEGTFDIANTNNSATAYVRLCIGYSDINNIAVYLNA